MHAGHCFFEQAVLFVAVAVLSVANAIIVDGTGHETASLMIRTPTKLCQEANARIHAWLEPSIIPSVVCHFRPFGKRTVLINWNCAMGMPCHAQEKEKLVKRRAGMRS